MPARTAAACSPMPPVNTSVSRPPSTAASAPICLRTLVAEHRRRPGPRAASLRPPRRAASACRDVVARERRAARTRGRRARSRRVGVEPVLPAAGSTSTPGSRSPVRVPITTPPVGVRPIVVSTDARRARAARLAPLPRCAMHGAARASPRRRADDVLVRQAVEAVAADARVRTSASRQGKPCATSGRCGGTRCRSRRPAGSVRDALARRARCTASAAGRCSGAKGTTRRRSSSTSSSTSAGST